MRDIRHWWRLNMAGGESYYGSMATSVETAIIVDPKSTVVAMNALAGPSSWPLFDVELEPRSFAEYIKSVELSPLRCIFCKLYLFDRPRQAPCGHRMCGSCYSAYTRDQEQVTCPECREPIELEHCFRDRAAEKEVFMSTLKCTNAECLWEGEGNHFQGHMQACTYAVVPCTNSMYGCQQQLQKREMHHHLMECPYIPAICQLCRKKLPPSDLQKHHELECDKVIVDCTNNCGTRLPRRELPAHLNVSCRLQVKDCDYKDQGCHFRGTIKEIIRHEREQVAHHLQLLKQAYENLKKSYTTRLEKMDQSLAAIKNQLRKIRSEVSANIQPVIDAVIKLEPTIQQMQEGFNEMELKVQTLQATSYNGTYVWKIPEVQQRRREAAAGKITSLYSAPFYTSRHGYKMCLRVYMNGDGSGKGTHLSFFFCIMKGEYDALLTWPFKQKVTLTLLDQDNMANITHSFSPEPFSSSWQRPRNEMNIASGFPKFAGLSVLSNTSYVKQDTLFLKCMVDCSGLTDT